MAGFKRITEYSADELEAALKAGISECESVGLDFWTIFKAFDSYNEKRRRKLESEKPHTPQTTV